MKWCNAKHLIEDGGLLTGDAAARTLQCMHLLKNHWLHCVACTFLGNAFMFIMCSVLCMHGLLSGRSYRLVACPSDLHLPTVPQQVCIHANINPRP